MEIPSIWDRKTACEKSSDFIHLHEYGTMKVYFYHTQDLALVYRQWQEGRFPGHLLYGATHLERYGIDTVMHFYKPDYIHRVKLTFQTAWRVLTCRQKYDVLYATSFRGIELIVLLRALHLFRKPVVIWHHQPIVKSGSCLREFFARFFYRGIDHMFFFSDRLMQESLKSRKAKAGNMQMVHWGADLDFYDRLMNETGTERRRSGFISTGKERRDMPTLVKAFGRTDERLDIYISRNACGDDYSRIFGGLSVAPNIKVNFVNSLIPYELAQKVCRAQCVVICCKETNYTVGLTTLVEAFALGIPVICSRNLTFAMDIDACGVGITVPYYDSDAWEKAIKYIASHPEEAAEMGRRGRMLAENLFNLENCTREVAEKLKEICVLR